MGSAVLVRTDYSAAALRRLARITPACPAAEIAKYSSD
jgi:hypothetical protein